MVFNRICTHTTLTYSQEFQKLNNSCLYPSAGLNPNTLPRLYIIIHEQSAPFVAGDRDDRVRGARDEQAVEGGAHHSVLAVRGLQSVCPRHAQQGNNS